MVKSIITSVSSVEDDPRRGRSILRKVIIIASEELLL